MFVKRMMLINILYRPSQYEYNVDLSVHRIRKPAII